MFVDRVAIYVEGGRGGDGCMSFRREPYVPRGGPDGGDGGHGGSVLIIAGEDVDSLVGVTSRKQWKAPKGKPGGGAKKRGRSGKDLVISVPPGTLVMDAGQDFVIKDLVHCGDQMVAARGGKAGKGNWRFKSATNQAPRTFTPGEEGEQRDLILELKVIADVALIGKPNAGKSTLLSRLSRARPAVADYPFTTKYPNLGLVQFDLNRSFVLADIPGLIEGAHEGVGLGHEFLRHIERAGILVHLVEPDPMDGTDPVTNYQTIRQELVKYNAALAERPEIVVITKSELPTASETHEAFMTEVGTEVLLISAVTGEGLNQLTGRIMQQLEVGEV